jgi:UV DNA damage endonuclease
MTKKIGFACKWIDGPSQIDGIKQDDPAKELNQCGTTVAWLNRQTRDVAEQKLWDLMEWNLLSIKKLVDRVGELDENLRMVRLGSDMLPMYTQPDWGYFWRRPDVVQYLERNFQPIGDSARSTGTRLSFHPGQFCVLASENDNIVERSIEEFEYHADMARWMGYGQQFQDFKINVHISGRKGAQGIRDVYGRLSPEARNTITIENEEMTHGLTDCLALSDLLPIVLDIHHNWVRDGFYIQPDDPLVRQVIDSWRGVRPTCHFSISSENILVGHDVTVMPDHARLLESGVKKAKLRAHSNFYWNQPVNEWALSFLETHDIMCESKAKNLASFALAKQAQDLKLI